MKLILSNTAHDAYHKVLDELGRRLPDGGEHIVIVPDKFTASSERGVIGTLGLKAVFNVSVTSFMRLAEKMMGQGLKKCLTPQGSVMLLAKVIEEKRGELGFYARAAQTYGFPEEFYAALTAVRNSGISPAELREAARRAPSSLKGKLDDMALLYEAYLEALGERRSDSSTRLEAFAEYLNGDTPVPAHFYVVDFYDFKAPELGILCGLAKNALSLTVGMVSGFSNPNRRIYCDGAAARLAKACGGAERVESTEKLSPPAEAVSRRLFSYELPESRVECGDKVRIVAAHTRAEEIDFLMREINEKVRGGARYRDFEVVLSDLEGYKHELKSAFLRCGIPFFIDTRELLAEQTKTRALLSAVAAARSGFRLADVLEFAKNPLFVYGEEGGEDDIFRFENYCRRYRRDRSRLLSPFTLGEEKERAGAERVRARLAETLSPFVFKGEITAEEFVKRARSFLDGFAEAWAAHTAQLTQTSLYYAKCADQVDEKIASVLEEMKDTLSASGDAAYFERMLKATLQTVKIALVPTWLDCVYVGSTDNRYLGGGDIYILGANVGKLPAGAEGGAVITPGDEDALDALGVKVVPSVRQRVYSELMSVTEIMKRPKGRLVVCYPECDPSGELRPSTVVSELRGMLSRGGEPLPVERAEAREHGDRERELSSKYVTPKACAYEVLRAISSDKDRDAPAAAAKFMSGGASARVKRLYERALPPTIILPRAAEAVTHATRGRTSASRLETFFTCPYKHYFSYFLGLVKREEREIGGKDYGLILHGVLEKFFKLVKQGKVDAGNAANTAGRLFDATLGEDPVLAAAAEEPDGARLFARLRREAEAICVALFDAEERSEYKPFLVEGVIGGRDVPALTVEENDVKVKLRGRIDRADSRGNKFCIVDYKSYKSADISLADVYSGRRIQLFLYMQAIAEGKRMTPVGAFYLPLSFDFSKDGLALNYRGYLTDDEAEARKLDPLFGSDDPACLLPCKRDKKTGALLPPVHLGGAEFKAIGEYVKNLAGQGAASIEDGIISPEPLEGACRYCDYAGICAWQRGDGGIKSKNADPSAFAEDRETPRAAMTASAQEEEDEP